MIRSITSAQNEATEQYAQAGGIANEMLGNIRTVTALNAQPEAIYRYRVSIDKAMEVGFKKGFNVGLGNGLTFLASFLTYAIGEFYFILEYFSHCDDFFHFFQDFGMVLN